MTTDEHIQTARDFLIASDREFEAGDDLQASEKLWGAATHALRATLGFEGRSNGKHRDLYRAADRLASEHNDPAIASGFAIAGKFHANFYHGFMEEYEIEAERPLVRAFVERVLDLGEAGKH